MSEQPNFTRLSMRSFDGEVRYLLHYDHYEHVMLQVETLAGGPEVTLRFYAARELEDLGKAFLAVAEKMKELGDD